MLIRSAPSACMIAARIPGRSATRTSTRKSSAVSSNASRSSSSRFVAASPIQRAEEAGVAALERRLELLDPAAVLAERGLERVGVVEEDVDPDARVRAGDARHLAERRARGGERVVPFDRRGADLVQEQVRERVRKVADEREQPVVRVGVDRDGDRAERA